MSFTLEWFTEKMIDGYIYASLTMLGLMLLVKSGRSKIPAFLNVSNLFILLPLTINLVLILLQTIDCRSQQLTEAQTWHGAGYNFYIDRTCFTMLIATILLGAALQSVFLVKRFRLKPFLSFISTWSLLILRNFETIYVYITSLYRDYIPSSWLRYSTDSDKIWTILFSITYFAACWVIGPRLLKPSGTT